MLYKSKEDLELEASQKIAKKMVSAEPIRKEPVEAESVKERQEAQREFSDQLKDYLANRDKPKTVIQYKAAIARILRKEIQDELVIAKMANEIYELRPK